MKFHLALRGKRHQLGEIGVRPDQVADDVPFAGNDVYRGDADVAAVSDDVVRSGSPGEVPTQRFSALLSNEVEDDFGAITVG